ncbi:MAG: hypothetical protein AB8B72_05620 [Crocinitomicaceae bacterium]
MFSQRLQITPFYAVKFGDQAGVNNSPITSENFNGELLQVRHINPLVFGADLIFSTKRLSFSLGYVFNDFMKTKTNIQLNNVYTYEITDDYEYKYSDKFDNEATFTSKLLVHRIPLNIYFSPIPKEPNKFGIDAMFGLTFNYLFKEKYDNTIDPSNTFLVDRNNEYASFFTVYSVSYRHSTLQNRLYYLQANVGVRLRAPDEKFYISFHYQFNDGRAVLNSYTLFYGFGGTSMRNKTTGNGCYLKFVYPINILK